MNENAGMESAGTKCPCNLFSRFIPAFSASPMLPSFFGPLVYHHHTRPPTKSLLLAAAACQILCQSDTQI